MDINKSDEDVFYDAVDSFCSSNNSYDFIQHYQILIKMMDRPDLSYSNDLQYLLNTYEENLNFSFIRNKNVRSPSKCIHDICNGEELYEVYRAVANTFERKVVFLSAMLHQCVLCMSKVTYFNKFNEHFQLQHSIIVKINNFVSSTCEQTTLNHTVDTEVPMYKTLASIDHYISVATKKCKNKRCSICRYIIEYEPKNINETVNCNTMHAIYMIICSTCEIKYIGQTERKVKSRINEHLQNIKAITTDSIAQHFNGNLSCNNNCFRFLIIDSGIKDTKKREEKETKLINLIKTVNPTGLNIITKW